MTNINPSSLYCELIFLAGSQGTKIFNQPKIRIGRQPDNDFVTPDLGTSRIHAEIVWDNDVWKITNLNPANKITLNRQDIQQEAELHHFDEIGLGRCSQTLIRFLAYPHRGDTPDPQVDTTLHISASSPDAALLAEDKHKGIELQNLQHNPENYAWQLISIILAAISALITFFTLGPAMFVPGVITILIGMLLCISIWWIAPKKHGPLAKLGKRE